MYQTISELFLALVVLATCCSLLPALVGIRPPTSPRAENPWPRVEDREPRHRQAPVQSAVPEATGLGGNIPHHLSHHDRARPPHLSDVLPCFLCTGGRQR
jgi:hypothetical protein